MNYKNNSLFFVLFLILGQLSSLEANPAGVLPYATLNGKHVILLGIDHHRPGYWMDFGGQSDWNETPAETAAREFSEETMFCFYASLSQVHKKLASIAPLVVPNGYYMYLLEVPFVQDLNRIQRDLRAKHHIKGRPGSGCSWLMEHHVEKIDYAWVYADDLKEALVISNGKHKIILKSIDGRSIVLHSLLAKSLSCGKAQNMLNALQ